MGANQSQFGAKTSVYKVNKVTLNKIKNVSDSESGEQNEIVIKTRDGYYKNKKGVFYEGVSLNLSKKERMSFQKLKYGYAKTEIHVFYKGNIIEGANPKSFITINRKNMPEEYKKLNSVIGMDFENGRKRIYQFGIKLLEF